MVEIRCGWGWRLTDMLWDLLAGLREGVKIQGLLGC